MLPSSPLLKHMHPLCPGWLEKAFEIEDGNARSARDCVARTRQGDRSDCWPQEGGLEPGYLCSLWLCAQREHSGLLKQYFFYMPEFNMIFPTSYRPPKLSVKIHDVWARDSSSFEKGVPEMPGVIK